MKHSNHSAASQNNTGNKKPSASAFNHMKHGCTSASLFLKDENPDDYVALLEDAFQTHQPDTDQAAGIVARSVHDQWILLRRERAVDTAEAALFFHRPDPAHWLPGDVQQMNLLDRYRTTAARAYTRSLRDLQFIQKLHHDTERWKLQLESEKQKLAVHLERFEMLKKQKAREETVDDLEDFLNLVGDASPAVGPIPESAHSPAKTLQQTLFIGYENDNTVFYEVTPSNEKLSSIATGDHLITRTYNFVGAVPPEFETLIDPTAVKWGKSTSVQKTYSFDDWQNLADVA
jgi:hypothetical protein